MGIILSYFGAVQYRYRNRCVICSKKIIDIDFNHRCTACYFHDTSATDVSSMATLLS